MSPPAPPATGNGQIIVTIATNGAAPDPDGYSLTVNRVWNRRVTINTRESFPDLPAQQHVVELLDVTHRCITRDGSRRLVLLAKGATVEVSFTVDCVPPTDSGDVYAGAAGMYDLFNSNHGSLTSRYVLHDDGVFSLQFSSQRHGDFEYLGWYARADTLLTFQFEGWSVAGEWAATGILRGDTLSVRYNLIMSLSDFIDGLYVRSPVPP